MRPNPWLQPSSFAALAAEFEPSEQTIRNRLFQAAADRGEADLTYGPTAAGFLYLAVVLDVFSRRVIGWSMRHTMQTTVVLEALDMAATQRRAPDVSLVSKARLLLQRRWIELPVLG